MRMHIGEMLQERCTISWERQSPYFSSEFSTVHKKSNREFLGPNFIRRKQQQQQQQQLATFILTSRCQKHAILEYYRTYTMPEVRRKGQGLCCGPFNDLRGILTPFPWWFIILYTMVLCFVASMVVNGTLFGSYWLPKKCPTMFVTNWNSCYHDSLHPMPCWPRTGGKSEILKKKLKRCNVWPHTNIYDLSFIK